MNLVGFVVVLIVVVAVGAIFFAFWDRVKGKIPEPFQIVVYAIMAILAIVALLALVRTAGFNLGVGAW